MCRIFIFFIAAFFTVVQGYDISDVRHVNYTNHPCNRECKPGKTMTCEYIFVAEWYYTMSKACYDCPSVISDCNRRHCVVGDGTPRMVVSINRQIPGPPIRVCEGDTIKVHVSNHFDNGEGLAIHWHGLTQKTTPFMDGATMLTQCPIASGTTFTYEFPATPPGTHWYHAHTGYQRSDGLVGSLVIKKAKQHDVHKLLYDHDLLGHVISVTDWGRETFQQKEMRLLHYGGNIAVDNAIFLGPNNYETETDAETGEINIIQRPIYSVKRNKRYRFRVGNFGSFACGLEITVDSHVLKVIAVDGADVAPYDVTSVILMAGERVDFVIHANQPIGNYWVRVKGDFCGGFNQQGILRYDWAPSTDPTSSEFSESHPSYKVLGAIQPPPAPDNKGVYVSSLKTTSSISYPDLPPWSWTLRAHFVRVDFHTPDNPTYNDPIYYPNNDVKENQRIITPMLNNVSYEAPPISLLTQPNDRSIVNFCDPLASDFNRTKHCQNDFCKCTHTINLPHQQWVDIVLYIGGGVVPFLPHPIHLHGYHFYVMAMGRVDGDLLTDERIRDMYYNGEIQLNTNKPPLKDTIVVPSPGYAVVRIYTDNPGFWFMHCHFENHFALGMAMILRVGQDSWFDAKPPAGFPTCGTRVPEVDPYPYFPFPFGIFDNIFGGSVPRTLDVASSDPDSTTPASDAWFDEKNKQSVAKTFLMGLNTAFEKISKAVRKK